MTHVEDLIYYDGPLLSLYKTHDGTPVIRVWLDVNDDFNLWANVEVSYSAMCDYLAGRLSLTGLVKQSRRIMQYKQDDTRSRYDEATLSIKCYLKDYAGTEDNTVSEPCLEVIKRFDLA